jgi:hypothetical protein
MEFTQLSLIQKIMCYFVPLLISIPVLAFLLLKLIDCGVDGWRNNNQKKKWIFCGVIAFIFSLRVIELAVHGS